MPIELSLEEKCYLVSLFGDLTLPQRERLFLVSEYPPQAGPIVMEEGRQFLANLRARNMTNNPLFDFETVSNGLK